MTEARQAARELRVTVPDDPRVPPALRVLRALRVWLVLLVTLGCWQLATKLFDIPTYLLPAPSLVVDELVEKPELYLEALRVTAIESVSGFLIAALAGFLFGIL